jgi:hypothetical protein
MSSQRIPRLRNEGVVKQYVVHCKKSGYDVYIGRPNPSIPSSYQNAKWGNPFKIGEHGTREDVIKKYEEWFVSQPELVKAAKKELKGKILACWCSPQSCHGDVLARVANEGRNEESDVNKE